MNLRPAPFCVLWLPLLAGCGDLGDPLKLGPACELSVASLDFGAVTAGTTARRGFVVRSRGTAPLTGNVSSGCDSFAVISGSGPFTLQPGESLAVVVEFHPAATGTARYECALDLDGECGPVTLLGTGGTPGTVSYAADIQPIFNTHCVGCHPGSGSLNLSSGASHGALVNVVSFGYAPARRVAPGDPAGSVLYGKVINSGQYGGPMPQGGALIPLADREKIRTWILNGAPDN